MSSALGLVPLPPLKSHSKIHKGSQSSSTTRRQVNTPAFGSRQPRFTTSPSEEFREIPGPGSYHYGDDRSLIINSPSLSSRGYINAFVSKANTYRGSLLEDETLPFMTQSQSMLEMENSAYFRPTSTSQIKRCSSSSTSSFANSAERMPFDIPPR